jgi:hypothetical protein
MGIDTTVISKASGRLYVASNGARSAEWRTDAETPTWRPAFVHGAACGTSRSEQRGAARKAVKRFLRRRALFFRSARNFQARSARERRRATGTLTPLRRMLSAHRC